MHVRNFCLCLDCISRLGDLDDEERTNAKVAISTLGSRRRVGVRVVQAGVSRHGSTQTGSAAE